MKLLLRLGIFIVLGLVGVLYLTRGDFAQTGKVFTYAPCDTPIQYRIGEIDPRFNLKEQTVLADVENAAGLWNTQYGKNIFVYNHQGELTVNFVYDRRSDLNSQITNLEGKVSKDKKALDSQIAEYKNLAAELQSKINSLNAEINAWNEKGGAPPEEYQRLKAESERLNAQVESINQTAQKLNLTSENYNLQVGNLNETIGEFNAELVARPEEGLYDGATNTIEIYFVTTKDELLHTLAHELGHAGGIEHNENPKAIMYSYASQSTKLAQEDIAALQKVCAERSIFHDLEERINLTVSHYSGLLQEVPVE